MIEISKEVVGEIVEKAIGGLPSNPLGLKLAADGVHEIDGRWWAVVDASIETRDRTKVWDAVAELEEIIESEAAKSSGVKVLVTAA